MPSATKGPVKKREYGWMKTEKKDHEGGDVGEEQRDAENEGGEEPRTSGGRNRGRDWRSILEL
jgi:hypothetical protein